jgi:hypothetical protein
MTDLLEKAFAEATKLSASEQDALANWLLAELESERHWQERMSGSATMLEQLADEALAEYRAGKTEELDPDNL